MALRPYRRKAQFYETDGMGIIYHGNYIHWMEEARLDMALEALARSLSSLESVDEVRFLVDGEFAASYGSVDISEPYLSE